MRASPPALALLALLTTTAAPARAEAEADVDESPVTFVAPQASEQLVLYGLDPDGALRPPELDLLSQLLRCRRTGRAHAVHPQLGRFLVALARRFGRQVHVLSGFRAVPTAGHPHSLHARGMAADISIPGVPVQDLRDFAVARQLGGIGFYPTAGFVHVDVRDSRFWWVDYSPPGRRESLVPDPEGTAPASLD